MGTERSGQARRMGFDHKKHLFFASNNSHMTHRHTHIDDISQEETHRKEKKRNTDGMEWMSEREVRA